MQRISIAIDNHLKAELDDITDKAGRTAFINQAIRRAVDDWHKQQAPKKILDFQPYKIDQDSTELLREVREERTQKVVAASQE